MFDKLKRALTKESRAAAPDALAPGAAYAPVSEWASTQGFTVKLRGGGQALSMHGKVGGKPWLLEVGTPSRDYITGEEVRARAELGTNEDVAVLVISRMLKEELERRAYEMITDTLQTTGDPNLPEEMRWLAMYDEVAWESLPIEFWDRYAVLADRRDNALAWLDPQLAQLMLDWPEGAKPTLQVPIMVLMLRGKAYMRMQYSPAVVGTVQHAAQIFASACESAIGAFSTDLPL